MRILIDIGHPAHVHFFKNFIWKMQEKDHNFLVTARDKEITLQLLQNYKIPYVVRDKLRLGYLKKIFGILKSDYEILKQARNFKPDIFLSIATPYPSHIARLLGSLSITFLDTEHALWEQRLSLSDFLVTPSCFKKDLGKKQVRYNGYHELAYLHPNYFTPNPSVLNELNLSEDDKFFILRFVSWQASHDIGQKGFTLEDKRKLVKELDKHGRVLITSESKLPKEFEEYRITFSPEKIHDLLYYADMYVGEGGTMASEAAVLGTPSVRVSTVAKHMGIFNELRDNYKLLYFFDRGNEGIQKAKELLESDSKKLWKKKRKKLLKDKIDVTSFMEWFVENYPESAEIMKENPIYQNKF